MSMEKMDWMLGMTQNMMSHAEKNMDMDMMPELYAMTSAMMGNLNYMKISMMGMDKKMMSMHHMQMGMMEESVNMMEMMMRNMETMMSNMDMNDMNQKNMMKTKMSYMVWMQMNTLTMMKK